MPPFIFEILGALRKAYYAPRPEPTPIPSARWDDCPCYCVAVNDEWLSHILGVMEALDQYDTWIGTEAEVEDARQQVNEIMLAFMRTDPMKCGCDCNDTPAQPVLHQVTIDGQLQVSYDGGLTWVQDPEDERVTAPALPPPVTSGESATKCDAATNGLEHLKDAVAAVSEGLATAGTVTAVAGALATFICVAVLLVAPETFPAIYPLLVAAAAAAFGIGQAAYDAAFTNTVWDAMLCILYCHIGEDGHFTETSFGLVLADIPVKITDSIASYQLHETIKAMGLKGLNNICSYGNAADADCSACECDTCFDGWTASFATNPDPVTGTDANGDYLQWTAVITVAPDYRVRVSNDGNWPSADYSANCCIPGATRFAAFETGTETPATVSVYGFACGDNDLNHYGAVDTLPWWGFEVLGFVANGVYDVRLYL